MQIKLKVWPKENKVSWNSKKSLVDGCYKKFTLNIITKKLCKIHLSSINHSQDFLKICLNLYGFKHQSNDTNDNICVLE